MRTSVVSEPRGRYGRPRQAHRSDWPRLTDRPCTESDYLALETNRMIELRNGKLVVLPMPNDLHQTISFIFANLLFALSPFGKVLCAPIKLKLKAGAGEYREPDIVYLIDRNDPRRGKEFWTGADVVVEIVSPGGEKRDTVQKRAEYAASGIAEYWIVDPVKQTMTVLTLTGMEYVEHGVFRPGERARSVVLKGFDVDVAAVLKAD